MRTGVLKEMAEGYRTGYLTSLLPEPWAAGAGGLIPGFAMAVRDATGRCEVKVGIVEAHCKAVVCGLLESSRTLKQRLRLLRQPIVQCLTSIMKYDIQAAAHMLNQEV